MNTKSIVLLFALIIAFNFECQSQVFINSFSFTSNASSTHDTLFVNLSLAISEDSLENYQIEFDLNEILSGDTVSVDKINIEFEDYGAADVPEIEFTENTGALHLIIGILPSGNYILQGNLSLLNGIIIEQTQIQSE